ncbi:penicillin acylase family protein, partial [archaeon]|nr:penicillin acylase family protein [archaeon]
MLDKYRSSNEIANIDFDLFKDDKFSLGSNNWALSSEKSINNSPILANDPHRSLSNPSLRYMAHLIAPGWNVIGGGEPEIPGISIGHNGIGAWGLTVFRTDAEDLYVYELNPRNSNQYYYKGEWRDFKIIKESIPIKDKDDLIVNLFYSIHGPVTFIDSERNKAYAVKNGWSEIGGSPYLASLRMDQSKNWDEFREASTYFNIPGENMVWADKYGDIGWQAVGIAPIRNTHSGMVPVSGDGNFEWDGYLPIIEKPNVFNPQRGFISTANQNVTPSSYENWNAIGFDWSDPYRGERIDRILESKQSFDIQEMLKLQVDYYSIPAEQIINLANNLITDNKEYFTLLENWDKKLEKNSIEAGIYIEWQNQIRSEIQDQYIPDEVKDYIEMQLYRVIDILSKM